MNSKFGDIHIEIMTFIWFVKNFKEIVFTFLWIPHSLLHNLKPLAAGVYVSRKCLDFYIIKIVITIQNGLILYFR